MNAPMNPEMPPLMPLFNPLSNADEATGTTNVPARNESAAPIAPPKSPAANGDVALISYLPFAPKKDLTRVK